MSHTNGLEVYVPLEHRVKRLEDDQEAMSDRVDHVYREVATIHDTISSLREDNERHHQDLMGIVKSYIDEDRATAKARQRRMDRCLGVVETAVQRVTEPKVLLVLAAAILVSALAGTGLAVQLGWLSISPAGVPKP